MHYWNGLRATFLASLTLSVLHGGDCCALLEQQGDENAHLVTRVLLQANDAEEVEAEDASVFPGDGHVVGGRPNATRTGFDMTRRTGNGALAPEYRALQLGGGPSGQDSSIREERSRTLQTQQRRTPSQATQRTRPVLTLGGENRLGGRAGVNRITGEGLGLYDRMRRGVRTVATGVATTATGVANTVRATRNAVVTGVTTVVNAPRNVARAVTTYVGPTESAQPPQRAAANETLSELNRADEIDAEVITPALAQASEEGEVDTEEQAVQEVAVAAAPGEPGADPQPGLARQVARHASTLVTTPFEWLLRGVMGLTFTNYAVPVVVEGAAQGAGIAAYYLVGPYMELPVRIATGGMLYQLPQLGQAILNVGWDLPENVAWLGRTMGHTAHAIYNGQLFEIDWARRTRDMILGGVEYGARGATALTFTYFATPTAIEMAAAGAQAGVTIVFGPAGLPARIAVGGLLYGSPIVGAMIMRAGWYFPEVITGVGNRVIAVAQGIGRGARGVYNSFFEQVDTDEEDE